MKNKIEYILFIGFSYLIRFFGLKLSRKFSWIIAFIFFYLIPIRKDITLSNLKKAFPDYSRPKVKRIAFGSYRSFLIALIEILHLPAMTRDAMRNAVLCPNASLIREKYSDNKGVILLSAHFGNWEYEAASTSLQAGLPYYVVVKPQRNPFVTNWLNNMRIKWDNKVVSLGISIRDIYKNLKEKNLVAMVADQRGPYEGIRVNFFGIKTAVYSGPAVLAIKTNAPIIYGIPVRQSDYSYKTILEEISTENLPENEEEKIIEISQRHTSYLEKFIRQYPEQWLWMHKRWKY
jgi:KDO2-lipid IV(A) lauroyltransferase